MPAALALAGYLGDGLLGDPPGLPHPVRAIGALIAAGEAGLNRGPGRVRLAAGALLTLFVVVAAAGLAGLLVALAARLHRVAGYTLTALGIAVLLARRSLADEAGRAVYEPLAAGDLAAARQAVGRVVGRDTAQLDGAGVSRAAVETLAENASDGVVAPLFYAFIGGLPAIAAYKAVNTLDSMIGHRDERFRYFGRFAARLDDLANWLPARLTMLGLVAAAALTGRDAAGAWRAARAGAAEHPSPNAGWPEAAMAGALGVRLGGVNVYAGGERRGPVFNPAGRPPGPADIPAAVKLMHAASHLILALGLAAWGLAGWLI